MNGEERQKLRSDLLQELYNVYFNENGSSKLYDNDDLNKDIEKKLAYEYLEQKGLVKQTVPGGRRSAYRITASGIDDIEAKEKKSDFFI
jgi:predicted transcriptional regulator